MKISHHELEQYEIEYARRSMLGFAHYTFETFKPNWFHDKYYTILNDFAHGRIKKLAISVPPQHGKSEGSTRRLPSYILGLNPDRRVAIVSYSAPKARKFNREIQRIIDSERYKKAFPETCLNSSNIVTVTSAYLRNSEEFEIVNKLGSLKAVGVGGPLTGDPVDVLIMDDLYKDAMSAWSKTIRENVQDWYETVADTRLHNDSQQLMVFTRWHHDDLIGRECTPENGWTVLKFPALKVGAPTDIDPRSDGQPLWAEKHSRERLEEKRRKSPAVFTALYQQDPTPESGSIYKRNLVPISRADLPLLTEWRTHWDLAYTEKESNSASAYVTGGKYNNNAYITDIGFDWLEFPELLKWMQTRRAPHYIEQKASGKSAAQTLNRNGINAIEIPKSMDKIAMAKMASVPCEAGRVYVCDDILERLYSDDTQGILKFPLNAHDDLADAFADFVIAMCSDVSYNLDELLDTGQERHQRVRRSTGTTI